MPSHTLSKVVLIAVTCLLVACGGTVTPVSGSDGGTGGDGGNVQGGGSAGAVAAGTGGAPSLVDCGPTVNVHSKPYCEMRDPSTSLPVTGCWNNDGIQVEGCTHQAMIKVSSPETETVLCAFTCPSVSDRNTSSLK
jgi:hypothetical protein